MSRFKTAPDIAAARSRARGRKHQPPPSAIDHRPSGIQTGDLASLNHPALGIRGPYIITTKQWNPDSFSKVQVTAKPYTPGSESAPLLPVLNGWWDALHFRPYIRPGSEFYWTTDPLKQIERLQAGQIIEVDPHAAAGTLAMLQKALPELRLHNTATHGRKALILAWSGTAASQ